IPRSIAARAYRPTVSWLVVPPPPTMVLVADATASPDPLTVAVVLAAGGGSRWDGPGHKLLAELDGMAVVQRAVRAAVDAAIGPVVVVTGAVPLEELVAGVEVVVNDRWASGQASSLQLGIARADALGADAVVVGLGDQPAVGVDTWRAVAAGRGQIAVATYDGDRRPPVRLAREVWSLLPESGDEGARALLRLRPELVTEVACAGDPRDVDRMEDLGRWS
ncbi:MAG TPA: nucleotidyltransferase family protein, partial [Microthrixaceae bacterium]|nr:nucleotidyltransferase family protein [Microthrixaceae bacterium]